MQELGLDAGSRAGAEEVKEFIPSPGDVLAKPKFSLQALHQLWSGFGGAKGPGQRSGSVPMGAPIAVPRSSCPAAKAVPSV